MPFLSTMYFAVAQDSGAEPRLLFALLAQLDPARAEFAGPTDPSWTVEGVVLRDAHGAAVGIPGRAGPHGRGASLSAIARQNRWASSSRVETVERHPTGGIVKHARRKQQPSSGD